MTDIVTPPTIDAMPPAPQPTDTREQFNQKAFPHAAAQQTLVTQANANSAATYQNSVAANERAVAAAASAATATQQADAAMGYRNQANNAATTATTRRDEAATSASQAESSRIEASKLNLGAKATAPTVDNQGQALRVGATYFDTTLNKLRAWSGTAWADPVNVTAGVTSLNGKSGALNLATLAAYGITDFLLFVSGNADLNTLITPGQYRFNSAAPNSPPGVVESVVAVSRVAETGSHTVIDYLTGFTYTRGFVVPGNGSATIFSPWCRQLLINEPQAAINNGVIDLKRGFYFVDTVSANKTFSFANQVLGSSCIVELTHTAGAVSFAASVFPGGVPPSLTANRRHLFFFQLPSYANAWLASYLGNYPL